MRLANDRFEQFQTALKRHAFDMNYRIAVNRQTGVMQSFLGDMTADGGGRSNFTPSVVMVGATAAQSITTSRKAICRRSGWPHALLTPARRAVTARCRAWPPPR